MRWLVDTTTTPSKRPKNSDSVGASSPAKPISRQQNMSSTLIMTGCWCKAKVLPSCATVPITIHRARCMVFILANFGSVHDGIRIQSSSCLVTLRRIRFIRLRIRTVIFRAQPSNHTPSVSSSTRTDGSKTAASHRWKASVSFR